MKTSYSADLRERAVRAYLGGAGTYGEVADMFAVGVATLNRWLRRHREDGSFEPKKRGGNHPPQLDERARDCLMSEVERRPDATVDQLTERMREVLQKPVTRWGVYRALQARKVTLKKSPFSTVSSTRTGSSCCGGTIAGVASSSSRID